MCTPSNACFLGPIWIDIQKDISIGSAIFCTTHGTESLYFIMVCPLPPQNSPSHGGSGLPVIHGSLGPGPQPKWHLDQFSLFCTAHDRDRPTDHTTQSLTTGRIYVRSTAMRPKNGQQNDCVTCDTATGWSKKLHHWPPLVIYVLHKVV